MTKQRNGATNQVCAARRPRPNQGLHTVLARISQAQRLGWVRIDGQAGRHGVRRAGPRRRRHPLRLSDAAPRDVRRFRLRNILGGAFVTIYIPATLHTTSAPTHAPCDLSNPQRSCCCIGSCRLMYCTRDSRLQVEHLDRAARAGPEQALRRASDAWSRGRSLCEGSRAAYLFYY